MVTLRAFKPALLEFCLKTPGAFYCLGFSLQRLVRAIVFQYVHCNTIADFQFLCREPRETYALGCRILRRQAAKMQCHLDARLYTPRALRVNTELASQRDNTPRSSAPAVDTS